MEIEIIFCIWFRWVIKIFNFNFTHWFLCRNNRISSAIYFNLVIILICFIIWNCKSVFLNINIWFLRIIFFRKLNFNISGANSVVVTSFRDVFLTFIAQTIQNFVSILDLILNFIFNIICINFELVYFSHFNGVTREPCFFICTRKVGIIMFLSW